MEIFNNLFFGFVLIFLVYMKSVEPLQCFMCFSDDECEKDVQLVECNYDSVMKTSSHFSILPHAQSQQTSNKYSCGTYQAKLANSTAVQLSGCFFNTYNPCEEVNTVVAQKWTCKYCDSRDGCNPATKINYNFFIIILFAIITVYKTCY